MGTHMHQQKQQYVQQVRTYISRYTSIRWVQQVRTYSSGYVLTAAGSIFAFNIRTCINSRYMQYVHQQMKHVGTDCRCSRDSFQYISYAHQRSSNYVQRYVDQQSSTYVQQYKVRTGQQQVWYVHVQKVQRQVRQVRKYSNIYMYSNMYSVHQQVQYVRNYSNNRCSSRFSRYVRDLIVETWERHRL